MKCIKNRKSIIMIWSLPARGAWIEISAMGGQGAYVGCRSPPGERGLKYLWYIKAKKIKPCRSPPGERGLKCAYSQRLALCCRSRSPPGERGLKFLCDGVGKRHLTSRSPPGERGLKSAYPCQEAPCTAESLPARGAWIEIRIPMSRSTLYR